MEDELGPGDDPPARDRSRPTCSGDLGRRLPLRAQDAGRRGQLRPLRDQCQLRAARSPTRRRPRSPAASPTAGRAPGPIARNHVFDPRNGDADHDRTDPRPPPGAGRRRPRRRRRGRHGGDRPVQRASRGGRSRPSPCPCRSIPRPCRVCRRSCFDSHHDNNYVGAVKRLGAIRAEFGKLDPATAPGFVVNGLKREELIAWNSMILHEVYFGGLGAPRLPGRALAPAIERDFGSDDRWARRVLRHGQGARRRLGLGAPDLQPPRPAAGQHWAADHTMTLAGGTPILALDMYEHAYAHGLRRQGRRLRRRLHERSELVGGRRDLRQGDHPT